MWPELISQMQLSVGHQDTEIWLEPSVRPTTTRCCRAEDTVRLVLRTVNMGRSGMSSTRPGRPAAFPGQTRTSTQLSLKDSAETGASYQLLS